MKYLAFLAVCLSMLLFACTNYEKENLRLKDEIKMVRQENDYLKAEIVGLQKQLDELGAKMKGEREGLQKKVEEEPEPVRKRPQEPE